jgi:hypothetical protein
MQDFPTPKGYQPLFIHEMVTYINHEIWRMEVCRQEAEAGTNVEFLTTRVQMKCKGKNQNLKECSSSVKQSSVQKNMK